MTIPGILPVKCYNGILCACEILHILFALINTNTCVSCVIGFLPMIGLTSNCDWFISLLGGIITLLTLLHSCQLVAKLFSVATTLGFGGI
jgi:hypothetical protein